MPSPASRTAHSCEAIASPALLTQYSPRFVEATVAETEVTLTIQPDQPSLGELHAGKIAQACRLIETADEAPKLDDLAAAVGLSPHHFHRIFKLALGVTPKAYATAHRAKRVREGLGRSATVTEAMAASDSPSRGNMNIAARASRKPSSCEPSSCTSMRPSR